MGSRLREKPKRLFEVFVEIAKPEGENEAPFIIQQYPSDYDDKEALVMIPKFAYPCNTDSSQVDHFTFVLTDLDSLFRFGYCRHATGHQTCLCILSCLPWCEIYYKLLDSLAEITNRAENSRVLDFLKVTHEHEVPLPKVPVTIVSREEMFSFTTPDPSVLPGIPASRNLTEYYNAVDSFNMMLIFASMLHERRIYMTSRKLSRLTACIHAAEALLYPMHWQHLYIPVLPAHLIDYISAPMPYLIGVHSNLLEKLTLNRVDIGDAVLVDLDSNTVATCYDDLGDLPSDVSSYLKKNLKTDVVKSSMDAISKAFLQSLVRLIGGYRDALKFRDGEPITFDPEAFVQSRQSQRTQAFLEGMLTLQIFQQFIYGRLEILNNGGGFTDIFEQQATLYADKKSAQSVMTKGKKKGKEMFNGLKVKVKHQGKKAMAKISAMTDNDEKRSTFQASGGIVHSRQSIRQSSSSDSSLGPPPRPPPPQSQTKPATARQESVSRPKSKLTSEDSLDDMRLSYHKVDMTLMNDDDIQAAMMRSASAEMLPRRDSSGSSSVSSDSGEDDDSGNIPFDSLHSSEEGEGLVVSPDGEEGSEIPVDITMVTVVSNKPGSSSSGGDKLILSRPRPSPSSSTTPVAPPRGKRSNRASPNVSPMATPNMGASRTAVQPQSATVPKPLPRTASMRATTAEPSLPVTTATVQDAPLIRFESSESDATDSDIFDPLAGAKSPSATSPQESSLETDGIEGGQPLQRNVGSRSSLSRTKAFRRESVGVPLRPGYREDKSPDNREGSTDHQMSSFDPLSDLAGISLSATPASSAAATTALTVATTTTSPKASDPLASHSPRRQSSDLLMHEWSLASLPKAPTIVLPVNAPQPGYRFQQPSQFRPTQSMSTSQWAGNSGAPAHMSGHMVPAQYQSSRIQNNPLSQSVPGPQAGTFRQTQPAPHNKPFQQTGQLPLQPVMGQQPLKPTAQPVPLQPTGQVPAVSMSNRVSSRTSYSPYSSSHAPSTMGNMAQTAPRTGSAPAPSSGSPFYSGGFRHVQSPASGTGTNSGAPRQLNSGQGSASSSPARTMANPGGVNKLPDNLFSEFLPGFGSTSAAAQGNAQQKDLASASPQRTTANTRAPPARPPQPQKWTTFD
ncbi:DENN domain-containing protein 1B isoform X2 [Aplysia californica]|uniref:DENN domain-containing protein 1B isoform X2 n=1 Tax=Aplysia californica TaxID=6500 RepID=A0ABM0JJQ3_APLCA|nr:DENN domain-containing protein 1B isoform X2 [Aplysia californica]